MEYKVSVRINEHLYLRDPEQSSLGRRIVQEGVLLFNELGFEDFTFKKLATRLHTNESSVYRYFENKHRLLVYLVTWYWRWMDFQLNFFTHSLKNPVEKLDITIQLLLLRKEAPIPQQEFIDFGALHQLVVKESSKAYLTRHVTEDNKQQLFKPYKDLCAHIAAIISECNSSYPYSRSLASTLIEMAHYQYFFMHHLPSLTDFGQTKSEEELTGFLKDLVYSAVRLNNAETDKVES